MTTIMIMMMKISLNDNQSPILHRTNLYTAHLKIYGIFVLAMRPALPFASILILHQIMTQLAVLSVFEPNKLVNHFVPQKAKLLGNSNASILMSVVPFQRQKEAQSISLRFLTSLRTGAG